MSRATWFVHLILSLLWFDFQGNAQILNMEKYRVDLDSAKNYAVNLNGSFTRNNRSAALTSPVNLLGFNFTFNTIYRPRKHALIFIAHRNFLRINENPFINFGYLHARINYQRKSRINYESYLQMSDDNFRGLNPRLLAGNSIRYRFVDSDKSDLILGSGFFFEYERWLNPITTQWVEVNFLKSSTNLVFRHSFSKLINFNGVVFYQIGYDRSISSFRHRYNGNVHLNFKISKHFVFTNFLDFSYEDRPVVPITKFIFNFRVGLGFEL